MQLVERLVEREDAFGRAALEYGQRCLSVSGWERAARRGGRLLAGCGELSEQVGGQARHVDRDDHNDVGGRGPEPGDNPGKRGSGLGPVVEDLEGEIERVGRLPDREALGASLSEEAPGTFRERLSVKARERLG